MRDRKNDIPYLLKEHGKCIERIRCLAKVLDFIGKNSKSSVSDIEEILSNFGLTIKSLVNTGINEIDLYNKYAIQMIVSENIEPDEVTEFLRWLMHNHADEAKNFLYGLASTLDEDNCGYKIYELILSSSKTDKLLELWKENAAKRQRWNHLKKEILDEYLNLQMENKI